MKYPVSVKAGKLSERFLEVLSLHVPIGSKILDPTCGIKHLWEDISTDQWQVTFSDYQDFGQAFLWDINDDSPFDSQWFDCIVYDPPYFFGYFGSKDPRKDAYGDYCQEYGQLIKYMNMGNSVFPALLQPDGKLIVKCSDQYQIKERKFYPHHITWANRLTNFDLVDIMIYQHHRISPTAFQVKDRPCCVIMHTYFLVFKKK